MINKLAILAELEKRQFTQGEIAVRYGCSVATVGRIAHTYQLGIGRGIKNHWQFVESSEALCYVIGVYLTDGSLQKNYRNKHLRGFILASTSLEFITYTEQQLTLSGLKPRQTASFVPQDGHGKKERHAICAYSKMFADWLVNVCLGKSHIPEFLFNAPISHQVAFVCGAIDGDGHVTKNGSIRIRGIDTWLYELPQLLNQMNVRTSGCNVTEHLKSGKDYLAVSIRREDFRRLNPYCAIPEKQDRLFHAKSRTLKKIKKRYPCPICGENKMSKKNGRFCADCYRKSESFYDHLKHISPIGNKIANDIRWGH